MSIIKAQVMPPQCHFSEATNYMQKKPVCWMQVVTDKNSGFVNSSNTATHASFGWYEFSWCLRHDEDSLNSTSSA